MDRYPFCSNEHIMHCVNRTLNELIIQIFVKEIQLRLIMFDSYLFAGFELHGWLPWKYYYT